MTLSAATVGTAKRALGIPPRREPVATARTTPGGCTFTAVPDALSPRFRMPRRHRSASSSELDPWRIGDQHRAIQLKIFAPMIVKAAEEKGVRKCLQPTVKLAHSNVVPAPGSLYLVLHVS